MRYLVAVCALVSAFAMVACGGDDDDDSAEVKSFVATVPATTSTVAAVQGQAITIANGQVFGGPVGSNPATLIFGINNPTAFTLTQTGAVPLAGTVNYGSGGSCTFIPTVGGGGALSVSTCNLVMVANNVVVGTGQVSGIITLVLNNGAGVTVSSNSLTATEFLDNTGELFVVNPATGQSVDMGIQP